MHQIYAVFALARCLVWCINRYRYDYWFTDQTIMFFLFYK